MSTYVCPPAQFSALANLVGQWIDEMGNFFAYGDFQLEVRPSGVIEFWLHEDGCPEQSGAVTLVDYVYPNGRTCYRSLATGWSEFQSTPNYIA